MINKGISFKALENSKIINLFIFQYLLGDNEEE